MWKDNRNYWIWKIGKKVDNILKAFGAKTLIYDKNKKLKNSVSLKNFTKFRYIKHSYSVKSKKYKFYK